MLRRKRKLKKRLMSLLLVFLLVATLVPFTGAAADRGTVRVIVENTTARGESVSWQGLLFDRTVEYTPNMTMEDALTTASRDELGGEDPLAGDEPFLGFADTGFGPFLTSVKGLAGPGGWMAALNDWFTDTGMAYARVQPGDTVRVMYTLDWGADIGGDWNSTDKGLKDLSFSAGSLYPAFSHDITAYTLYLPADVGSVRIAPTAVSKNNKVTLTADGETEARWGARTFAADAGTVTVQVAGGMTYTVKLVPVKADAPEAAACAGDAKCPSVAFQDVDRSAKSWYHIPVDWAVTKEITKGIDETHFGPDSDCTRAQMVTFLWRASGSPAPTGEKLPFVDVAADQYYTKAVIWAQEKGITNGVDKDHFAPDATVTRAQTVTFLWRLEGKKQLEADSAFDDVKDGEYYTDAVIWATENNVTNGMTEKTFAPDANCKRAQIVTFLWRDKARAADAYAAARAAVIAANGKPVCGTGDWAVFDAVRNAYAAGESVPAAYRDYYKTVADKARATGGKMDAKYATDYARYVLAVTALGYDATNVGGYDLTAPLNDPKYAAAQGVNGVMYALIALDSADYPSYNRADYVRAITDAQLPDGGWNYGFGDDADPDLTAMAIQALLPYPEADAALKKAVDCLSKLQTKDGGFPNAWGEPAAETTAQVLMAYWTAIALPGSAYAEQMPGLFTKDGGKGTLMNNLLSYQMKDGSFCHTLQQGTSNAYATEQALRALLAEQCSSLGVTLYAVR